MNEEFENIKTEASEDAEFAALIREGLDASFDAEDICVSEELIARTMKAISSQDEDVASTEASTKIIPITRRGRFIRIAGSIAAALVLGVIGISVIRNSGMKKGETAMNFMAETMAPMNNKSSSETTSADASVDNFYDYAMDTTEESFYEGDEEEAVSERRKTAVYYIDSDSADDVIDDVVSVTNDADFLAGCYPDDNDEGYSNSFGMVANEADNFFTDASPMEPEGLNFGMPMIPSLNLAEEQIEADRILDYLASVAEEKLLAGEALGDDIVIITGEKDPILDILDPYNGDISAEGYANLIEIYDTLYVHYRDIDFSDENETYNVEIFTIESGENAVSDILLMKQK